MYICNIDSLILLFTLIYVLQDLLLTFGSHHSVNFLLVIFRMVCFLFLLFLMQIT